MHKLTKFQSVGTEPAIINEREKSAEKTVQGCRAESDAFLGQCMRAQQDELIEMLKKWQKSVSRSYAEAGSDAATGQA